MMKKNYNSFHLLAVLALLLSTAVVSCNRDEVEPAEGDGILHISLQGAETRGASLVFEKDTIKNLRVIVCNGEVVEIAKLFIADEDDFQNPFMLKVTTGQKTVYVVANETITLEQQLSTVNSKSALDALLADQITNALALPLVMTGKTDAVDVTNGAVKTTIVELKRIAARIKLKFKKDTDKEVIITKVSLLNNSGKTSLFEGASSVTNQTYWDYGYPITKGIELADTLKSIPDEYVYVYENLAGASDKDNAVQLEVEALFNNIRTTYRVYINENVTTSPAPGDPQSSVTNPDDHLYSIKRNYSYELTGIITKIGESDGLVLSVNVLPWNRLTSNVDYELAYEIFPTIYDDNYEYEVYDPTDDQLFTFKLFNPLNSSWKAHLTNPVAFSFLIGLNPDDPDDDNDYVDSGITEPDNGVYLYTMKIKPNQVQDYTQRSTEFYITVNGIEIPLIKGSNKIGKGNRPVIYQPSKKP